MLAHTRSIDSLDAGSQHNLASNRSQVSIKIAPKARKPKLDAGSVLEGASPESQRKMEALDASVDSVMNISERSAQSRRYKPLQINTRKVKQDHAFPSVPTGKFQNVEVSLEPSRPVDSKDEGQRPPLGNTAAANQPGAAGARNGTPFVSEQPTRADAMNIRVHNLGDPPDAPLPEESADVAVLLGRIHARQNEFLQAADQQQRQLVAHKPDDDASQRMGQSVSTKSKTLYAPSSHAPRAAHLIREDASLHNNRDDASVMARPASPSDQRIGAIQEQSSADR